MAYAVTSDVTKRWAHEPSSEEATLIDTRLEDVERMIKRRIPDLDAKVVSGDIVKDDLIQVEADAVLRLVRNPEGYRSESDGDYTYELQRDLATGRLTILADEWFSLGVRRTGFAIIVPNLVMPT